MTLCGHTWPMKFLHPSRSGKATLERSGENYNAKSRGRVRDASRQSEILLKLRFFPNILDGLAASCSFA